MELRSIQSPVVSSIPTKGSIENRQLICNRQLISSFGTKKAVRSNAVKFKPIRFNIQASGFVVLRFRDCATTVGLQPAETKTKDGEKDENLVFVAGATGKVGSRTVRELLKLGFNVRAGVRSTQRAEPLVKSVQQMKLDDALSDGSQPIEKLQLVECDLEKPEQIKPALANASTVICCIGASEKEIFDVTGPYRIDFLATKNLIDAAAAAKAKHFFLVTSLGTNKFGFPAAVLNLFWGVLCWKRKAEEALLASGIPYTIVRPGGMERPTDSFKETHNLTLSPGDTLFGGLVSNLQVAELLAFMAKNPNLSYCKVLEVVAETTAPLTPMGDLLTKIPPQRPIPVQPKEPEAIKEPEPVPKKSTISESSSIATETQPQSKTASARPLSPYTVYEGLKPPTSPIPSTPGSNKAVVEAVSAPPADPETSTKSETITVTTEPAPVAAGLQKPRPLSPYTAYEGLKPPSSPIPTAPGGSKAVVEAVSAPPADLETITESESITITTEPAPVAAGLQKPRPLSPYTAYEGLKPPSSPIPTAPGGNKVVVEAKAVVEAVSAPPADLEISTESETVTITTEPAPVAAGLRKPRPLSPYTA
ncbi:putative NAD(P)-binding domain, NAD(P)-binding domain superfamily, protein [Helianthus annuus]|nr:putative NAD(P)-binding domain, NAD(P)-binding domain superfamily, protein [Helianthus annuus]